MPNKKPQIKCPYCHVFAQQDVHSHHFEQDVKGSGIHGGIEITSRFEFRRCSNCGGKFFYENGELRYPEPEVVAPKADMPEDVKNLFEEAASICHRSPRAACALLRLAIEKLCDQLGATSETVSQKIASLVKRGLSEELQKALDVVRVVGNNAVHPGQICFDVDDESTARMLFTLLNIITQRLVSEPATIRTLYEGLPEAAKQHVKKRDGK